MGFFSNLLGAVGGAIRGFTGTPDPVRVVAAPPPVPVPRALPVGPVTPPIFTIPERLLQFRRRGLRALPHPGPVGAPDPVGGPHVHMGGGRGGGNGQVARQTIVQTVDLMTGAVVRQVVFDGAPFLMNSDVRKLRSISRKVSKANSKIPRRVVAQSKLKQLQDAAVDEAMRKVGQPSCPPKC